jgi:hypothetical protein
MKVGYGEVMGKYIPQENINGMEKKSHSGQPEHHPRCRLAASEELHNTHDCGCKVEGQGKFKKDNHQKHPSSQFDIFTFNWLAILPASL